MRLSALGALALAVIFASEGARAEQGQAVHIHDLDLGRLGANAHFWHEKPGQISIEQASAASAASRFVPLQDEAMFALTPKDRLWIRIDIERKAFGQDHVVLWTPLPLLDSVTLYQQGESGKWRASVAGDRIAVSGWPEPGRYPRFHLDLPLGKSSIYLQIQGSTPVSIPLHIGSESLAQGTDRQGFLILGAVSGLVVTLTLLCFVTAYTYRDRLYLYYGVYMLLVVLAMGAYTGLSAYLLWNDSPEWADMAQGILAVLSVGGALYFIEAMLGGRQYALRLSAALLSLAGLSAPLALLYAFVPRTLGVAIIGVYIVVISFIGLSLAARAWRRGDQVGKWVFFAYFPLALAVLAAFARANGWIGLSWVVQYGVVVALMIEAPMMMVALHVRSRDRHEISTREQAMTTQDALTGLFKEIIFDDRIRQTLVRRSKHGEDSAIVLISLVNYDAIAASYGLPVAEQSILRCVIKLRRVLRDVDTVARVGNCQFGVIFEGESDRGRITEFGARLIAQGLMPLPGLVPEVILQFHVAAAVLRDLPNSDLDVKASLHALLASMSPRTRRPIRFLDLTPSRGDVGANVPAIPLTDVDALAAQVHAAETDGASAKKAVAERHPGTGVDSSGLEWKSTEQETLAQTSLGAFVHSR